MPWSRSTPTIRSRLPGSAPANLIGMTTAIVAPPGCPARLSAQPLCCKRYYPDRSGRSDGIAGREPRGELVARHRSGEQVALGDPDARGLERVDLLGELDALGDGLEAERLADEQHGARDVVGAGRRVLGRRDEAAVDLHLVHRQRAQVGERGVAGAEVVERDLHPEGGDLDELLDREPALEELRLGE